MKSDCDFIKKALGIKEIHVTGYHMNEKRLVVFAELLIKVSKCKRCGEISRSINQYISRSVKHLPIFGRECEIAFDEYQFECPKCGLTWIGELEFLDSNRLYTKKYEEQVFKLCEMDSFEKVARIEGLTYEIVEGVYKKVAKEKLSKQKEEVVRVLGIDEISIKKGHSDYMTVLSDIERGKVIEVLESRSKEALEAYFDRLGEERRKAIRVVSIDMWEGFYQASKAKLPHALVVIDKFHVIKLLNENLSQERKEIQKEVKGEQAKYLKGLRWILVKDAGKITKEEREKLEQAFQLSPELKQAYELKEGFKEFYRRKNKRTAKEYLERWITGVKESGLKFLNKFAETVKEWKEEILNYFQTRVTNSFVEGMNNKIKLLKRIGYGFRNRQNFALRIIVECGRI